MLCSVFVIPLFYCSKKQQMDQEPKQGDDGIKDVQDGSEEQSSCSATDSSQLVGQSQFFLTTDGAHKAILLCRPTSQDAWRNDRTGAWFFFQEPESLCYICQKAGADGNKLKPVSDKTWATLGNAAVLRKNLTSDKFLDATRRISVCTSQVDLRYHPVCYRHYTAVKRPAASQSPVPQKKVKVETRQSSSLPKSDQQGLLKGTCIFCGKSRKKFKGKEEPRVAVATVSGCQSLSKRAELSSNDRIKSLIRSGVDLIAKEAEYHKSCRVQFDKQTVHEEATKSQSYNRHKQTFESLCKFVEDTVIGDTRSVLVSTLLDMYKVEYITAGGDKDEIESYSAQNLLRKLTDKYVQKICVTLLDQRRGNIIFSSVLTEEDARAKLSDDEDQYKEDEKIRWAALHLRSQILQLPKSKTPNPATVQNLKECSPQIPRQLELFFRCLLNGFKQEDTTNYSTDRKVTALASDVMFNVSRGGVKPWKHTVMGLGLASLTGSKLAMQILNREGHSIDYSAAKGLETEFAYAVESYDNDTPDGIRLDPSLATACVWDNNDADVETLDGKGTLHATVGHTYQNVMIGNEEVRDPTRQFRDERNRRQFRGNERPITPFKKSIRNAEFVSTRPAAANTPDDDQRNCNAMKLSLKPLDLYWFWKLMNEDNVPLHAGFVSGYIKDLLPLQRICYMDPIPCSPTRNDVVKETMMRTMKVAQETGQEFAVVTYDLAVASKAYSIQALETPLFDKLLIMLGNFHIELAFFGAVGTYINESGVEFILTEADVLAEGSMMGFIKGKFYNRCTRIHQLLANVLEQKMYKLFLMNLTPEEQDSFQLVISTVPSDPSQVDTHLDNPVVSQHLRKYEDFMQAMTEGSHGPTAQFWSIYIYLISRLHREVQRCVKTNDVDGYIAVLPALLDVFFALNRPNYARWGALFLQKLKNAEPKVKEILDKGAFSVRRTSKDYSRSAVDLSLEQTVNRDAASQMRGIVAFCNSENAVRRWSLTMAQRAMAVTELRTLSGLEQGESAATQCRPSRIRKDNSQMVKLGDKIDEFCNPFSDEVGNSLVNVATGRVSSKATESYLINTIRRGQQARAKFQEEWDQSSNRFLKPVKRIPVQNFAAENIKKKVKAPASEMAKKTAESLRDMFIRMIVVVAEQTSFDLRNVLSYPITKYPLSLAHCDGTHAKGDKSTLLRKLESFQEDIIAESDLPRNYVYVHDGGLVLHSVLSQTNAGASLASIARTILSTVCSGRGKEVHLCFDKYVENSIKDCERKLRGAVDTPYSITGPEQVMRQSGPKLLTNGSFKNELTKFLLMEWKKDHYHNLFNGKMLFASYGGECYQYYPDEEQHVSVAEPSYLQGDHEEADTLIAFHVANITGNVIVRASDTDVLVILVGAIGQKRPEVRSTNKIIMDCGMGNYRRYIDVTGIANHLDEKKTGLAAALPGYHAFTGCDFTSAFYR